MLPTLGITRGEPDLEYVDPAEEREFQYGVVGRTRQFDSINRF